ncbi:unnamed protein product [Caenorhabditis nigoni]
MDRNRTCSRSIDISAARDNQWSRSPSMEPTFRNYVSTPDRFSVNSQDPESLRLDSSPTRNYFNDPPTPHYSLSSNQITSSGGTSPRQSIVEDMQDRATSPLLQASQNEQSSDNAKSCAGTASSVSGFVPLLVNNMIIQTLGDLKRAIQHHEEMAKMLTQYASNMGYTTPIIVRKFAAAIGDGAMIAGEMTHWISWAIEIVNEANKEKEGIELQNTKLGMRKLTTNGKEDHWALSLMAIQDVNEVTDDKEKKRK